MRKIQLTTAPIKADAQVIVLNASFVSRITKAQTELKEALNAIKESVNCALEYGQTVIDVDTNVTIGATNARIMFKDVNRIDRVMDLINDIYFAMSEDEDGTADVNTNNNIPRGIKLPQPARPQGIDPVDWEEDAEDEDEDDYSEDGFQKPVHKR